jgi:hypothetical protein
MRCHSCKHLFHYDPRAKKIVDFAQKEIYFANCFEKGQHVVFKNQVLIKNAHSKSSHMESNFGQVLEFSECHLDNFNDARLEHCGEGVAFFLGMNK